MIAALTGASGFIGWAAARALAASGHRVTALVRAGSRREHIVPFVHRFAEGDHADPSIWPELLSGADGLVHASVDWAALRGGDAAEHLRSNVVGSIRLIEAAHRIGVRRVVFLSSVAVHHDISPAWEGVIDEDHPLRPGSWYGAYKSAVEAHLWMARAAWDMQTAALRPAAVYGIEPVNLPRTHGFRQVERLLAGGRVTSDEFPGGGKFVHVEDVATAVVRALETDAASGRAFHLADCYAKYTRFAEHAAELLGLDPDVVQPDRSPPARNRFDTGAAREVLGVALDRGDEGLRAHVRDVIAAVRERR